MNSANTINYELRPCKFVERRMLMSSLSRIVGYFCQPYQYVGFGGLAFTDFKLFHKELNIDKLYSIEKMYSDEKLEFNKPFSQINILHTDSTSAINNMLDLTKPSIIWLDYDNRLEKFMFQDLEICLNRLPKGSVYIFSCNSLLKDDNNDSMTLDQLKRKFGNLVPYNLDNTCCTELNASNTICRM